MLTSPRVLAIGVLALVVASCGDGKGSSPLAPTPPSAASPAAPDSKALVVFREPASGFSTTDLYDAHGRVIQFTNGGDLVMAADGTHFPGYVAGADSYYGAPTYFIGFATGKCADFCVFSVRFGTEGGQRRAYLTVDYGHSNPGTLVDVVAANGALVVTQTARYPPGTPTLSGVVTEMTPAGIVPVAGAWVGRLVPGGWQNDVTDETGHYSVSGLIEGTAEVAAVKDGYRNESRQVTLNGDARLDIQLTRR